MKNLEQRVEVLKASYDLTGKYPRVEVVKASLDLTGKILILTKED